MIGLTPELIGLFIAAGTGAWMALAGVQKNLLEWRRRRRNCPSCGRFIEGRVCTNCG